MGDEGGVGVEGEVGDEGGVGVEGEVGGVKINDTHPLC